MRSMNGSSRPIQSLARQQGCRSAAACPTAPASNILINSLKGTRKHVRRQLHARLRVGPSGRAQSLLAFGAEHNGKHGVGTTCGHRRGSRVVRSDNLWAFAHSPPGWRARGVSDRWCSIQRRSHAVSARRTSRSGLWPRQPLGRPRSAPSGLLAPVSCARALTLGHTMYPIAGNGKGDSAAVPSSGAAVSQREL